MKINRLSAYTIEPKTMDFAANKMKKLYQVLVFVRFSRRT
jgi:hypothetical protein